MIHGASQHIRCRAIIEVMGKPKEHVSETISKYVEQLGSDETLMLLTKSVSEVKPVDSDRAYSSFAELEMVVKGATALASFCFYYMPSSVEIIKPEEIVLKNTEFTNIINDLQSKLHTVDMAVKKLRLENNFIRKNMKISLTNSISVLLKIRPMDIAELSRFMGANEKELKSIIDDMEKDGKLKKEEERYVLAA